MSSNGTSAWIRNVKGKRMVVAKDEEEEEDDGEEGEWSSRVFAWGSSAQGQCLENDRLGCISKPR